MKMKNLKPFLLVALLALLMARGVNAQSFSQMFCSGSGTAGGAIPLNNILSGQGAAEQGVLGISILIMLTMLIIVALIYMLAYVIQLDLLQRMAKAEIGEVFVTFIIVIVFLGAFNLAAAGTAPTTAFSAAGTSFGRTLYVDDCVYLSNASVSLIAPFLAINTIGWAFNIVTSVQFNIKPTLFGVSFTPFAGYSLFTRVIGILDDITGAFIFLILGTVLLLGFIYGLFPIFLYAGIVLRTLPWTRAAGGAFLGLFIGFYIVFPLLLHVMLSGYIGTTSSLSNPNLNSNIASFVQTLSKQSTGGSFLSSAVNFLTTTVPAFFSALANTGIINGYIELVLEPSFFTVLSLIVAFIISFDFAEAAGDLLGAPSLKAEDIFSKVI